MTAPTTLTHCPTWCVSDHLASNTLHYHADAHIPALSGRGLPVSAFISGDRPGVCVGGYELSPAQADELVAYLQDRIDLVRETMQDAVR